MKDVEFLVISDLHGSDKAIDMIVRLQERERFSGIVVCGDLTTYGSPPYVDRVISSVRSRLLAVPGNCDPPETVALLEKAGCSLHGRRKRVEGVDFFGFGGGLPSPSSTPFEVEEETMASDLERVGAIRGVMVTHAPPYGMNDTDHTGRHSGSRLLLKVAQRFAARAVLFGHIHEARGITEYGGTVYVNPGPARGGCYARLRIGEKVRAELS